MVIRGESDLQEAYPELLAVGEALQAARQRKNLSVHKLARLSGVSAGMISQIERGIANPSLNKISRLASVLGLNLGIFFEPKPHPPETRLVRAEERRKINVPDPNFSYELLTPDTKHNLEMIYVESTPGSSTEESPFTHEGEECMLVLQGNFEVHVGSEVYHLKAGDSFTLLDATIPHWYRNPGPETVKVVSAITPPTF